MELRRPVRGLLIGPVVAPIAYWVAMTADAMVHDVSFNLGHALREVLTICAFGIPIAYAVALVWGAPIIFVLRRLGALRASTVVVAGSLGGAMVAVWFALYQQGDLFRVRMPLPLGAVLGALAGGTCWWAGRGNAEPTGAGR
jgi:hypothetical protein